MELGSKGWILPISRVGGNEWRVKGEANCEERRGQGTGDGSFGDGCLDGVKGIVLGRLRHGAPKEMGRGE